MQRKIRLHPRAMVGACATCNCEVAENANASAGRKRGARRIEATKHRTMGSDSEGTPAPSHLIPPSGRHGGSVHHSTDLTGFFKWQQPIHPPPVGRISPANIDAYRDIHGPWARTMHHSPRVLLPIPHQAIRMPHPRQELGRRPRPARSRRGCSERGASLQRLRCSGGWLAASVFPHAEVRRQPFSYVRRIGLQGDPLLLKKVGLNRDAKKQMPDFRDLPAFSRNFKARCKVYEIAVPVSRVARQLPPWSQSRMVFRGRQAPLRLRSSTWRPVSSGNAIK